MEKTDKIEDTLSEVQKQLDLLVEELLRGNHRDGGQDENKTQKKASKTIICKRCKEKVKLYQKGKYPNGTKKWVDEEGRIANGRMCPLCNNKRARDTMRKSRSKDN